MLLREETWDRPEPWPRSHKRDDSRDPLLVAAFLIGLPFSKSKWDTDPCLHKHVSYPTPHSKNVWKSRSKNQQKSEKVAEIFVRKSREKIATRYSWAPQPSVETRDRSAAIASGASSVRSLMTCQRMAGSEARSHLRCAGRGA